MDVIAYALAGRSKFPFCCHCGGSGIITVLGCNDNACVKLVRRQSRASIIIYVRAML
jgi:hypothetical protein